MLRFLSVEYWRARICGRLTKPRAVGIWHYCPHCGAQILTNLGDGICMYVCRHCEKSYFVACELRAEIWKGE